MDYKFLLIVVPLLIMNSVGVGVVMVLGRQATNGFDLCNLITVDSSLISLICIVSRLCARHDEATTKDFFACYDNIPGRAQFLNCQAFAFQGRYLNTTANVDWGCIPINLPKLVPYGVCLVVSFTVAGINMRDAVTTLNKCQGAILGLNAG